ncbi:MAG: hypothetical protein RR840_01015 [Clostridium sp.]
MITESTGYRFYFFYLLGFILFCFLDGVLINSVAMEVENFNIGPASIIVITFLVNIVFGLFIASDHLIKEKIQKGIWMVDMGKIIVLSVPLGFLFIYGVLYFNGVSLIPQFEDIVFNGKYLPIMMFICTLLGYSVGSSFYKTDKELEL